MRILIFLLFLYSIAAAVAADCKIFIRQELKNKDFKEKVYHPKVQTEAECKKRAELHKQNFAGKIVIKKTVEFEWK